MAAADGSPPLDAGGSVNPSGPALNSSHNVARNEGRLCSVVSQIVGRWDEFQFLKAFHELARLRGFVTDFWVGDGSVRSVIARMLSPSKRAAFARCGTADLPGELAHIDLRAFACMMALRSGRFQARQTRLWRMQGAFVGAATKQLCKRVHAGAVFAYSYYAKWTFEGLPSSTLRLLHQVHPYAPALRRIYEREMNEGGFLSGQLSDEIEMSDDAEFIEALREGPRLADHVVAASAFTKATLVEGGMSAERISVIPYGADLSRFFPGPVRRSNDKPMVLFVGRVCARKGIGYLLEAWKRMGARQAELVIAGTIPDSEEVRQALSGARIRVVGRVRDAELLRLFQMADVLCLPSLVEGFGLVLLQSLACGTPIVGTDATGAADIVEAFPNTGRVVGAASARDLAETLDDVLTHIGGWRERRIECLRAASSYDWSTFREHVRQWYGRVGSCS
jgi:glycosyltransferase involved in cell wall biosynthesis